MLCVRRPHIQAEKNRNIKEEMQWQLEDQFTNQHILLAVVNGAGDLTIEKDRFRFKENKGYWIPRRSSLLK
ncbi:hypothetical protein M3598_04495 [Cytobacillus oceanisediminis]|uniref:hypothetical protein n=1 Tax=Cytobacillus oceanisediminis TaxID=665099 RepID=UPI00204161B0|nr:hypothetical protein [Cytobacillus oceanisediminis]MCM3241995.1 hypothetical protein [Cytobacillus oceanisediminis]